MAGISGFGLRVGTLATGPRDLITDVPGVRVGHCTVDQGRVHTGVTVVVPTQDNLTRKRPVAATFVQNGYGKTMGTVQVDELGYLETPVSLTNTLCVGRVADALVTDALAKSRVLKSANPVVGETNDGRINDIRNRAIEERHVLQALADASETFALGAVGAGRGTVCFGLKGGIGSASRLVEVFGNAYTLGVLVQSNFGLMEDLVVCGKHVGQELVRQLAPQQAQEQGSIMVVVATDAPITSRQVRRVIKRATVGLSRTGSHLGNGSGDVFIGFTTANVVPARVHAPLQFTCLPDDMLDPLFRACAEATEEAVLSSLLYAEPLCGADGTLYHSLSEFIPPVR